ncbi:hypothetical protein, partial [Dickeya parazeae]|uniref:hypothetical protein n=1 Tax=Dickeya parazeae TaxID=2893572 RepID=UPI001AECDEE3
MSISSNPCVVINLQVFNEMVLCAKALRGLCFLYIENPQLGWGFRKASSFGADIKTPFDLLKHLAVWQL